MIVFKLICKHQTIVSVAETSSKMTSTLCQELLTIFLSKSTKFCMVQTIRFCSNSTSMWSKYHIIYGESLDFQCQHHNANIKCPIGKSIFAINLPLKLFRATIANADLGSLKSLHTFLEDCLYMLVEFVQNTFVS